MSNRARSLSPLNIDTFSHSKLIKINHSYNSSAYILPPISRQQKLEFENQPSSVITKFIETLSSDLKNETDEIINERELLEEENQKNKKEELKKRKTTIKENKDKNTFITDLSLKKDKDKENEVDKEKEKEEALINNPFLAKSTKILPIPINAQLSYLQKRTLSNIYRRIRNYQPRIDENWKFKCGLAHSSQSTLSVVSSIMNNIDFQSRVIQDQVRLLIDNITYYKMSIVSKDNYIEGFKAMSLKLKVKMNKSLEETCGILLLLPQLLLLEFYHFIEKFNNVNVPDKKKFREKYVFDEVECLFYNNNLLTEVTDFFKSCFEVYSTLVKEVEDMILQQKNFEHLITIIEKARYNMSNVVSSSENGIKNYENDLKMVDKILKNEHKEPMFKVRHKNLTDKLRGQFIFKKNDERQRIIRITNTLKLRKDDDDLDEMKINEKREFKSIIHTKLIDGLLPYCRKKIKQQIQSRRIMDEMEPFKNKNENKKQNPDKLKD